jgi:hypothetical protein
MIYYIAIGILNNLTYSTPSLTKQIVKIMFVYVSPIRNLKWRQATCMPLCLEILKITLLSLKYEKVQEVANDALHILPQTHISFHKYECIYTHFSARYIYIWER